MTASVDDSCFVRVLSHYVKLTPSEKRWIARLEAEQCECAAKELVHAQGDPREYLYVVSTGWFYSSTSSNDERLVVQLHHPGDVVGFQDLAYAQASASLHAMEAGVLCPIRKSAIARLCKEEHRLGLLLLTLATREQAILYDTLRWLSRLRARDRLLLMLLQLLHRLKISNPDRPHSLRLPMNQQLIGDFLGLTNVSVSNAFKQLTEEGVIDRQGKVLSINDVESCLRETGYIDRYGSLSIDWMSS